MSGQVGRAGQAGRGRRMLAKVWGILVWRPRTWRQAMVDAVVLGALFVGLQLLFNVLSTQDNRFLVWWVPLWFATSMSGYAFWSWLDRRHRPLQESGPPR